MKLNIGFSPCPNDTFIFDALINGKIDTEGLEFEPLLEDVQTLNNWAIEKKLDISKISYGALPLVLENYIVLNSGGALGKGVGPLLISKAPVEDLLVQLKHMTVAVPGENTTANLLFSYAFPSATKKKFMIFHEIEAAVLSGEVDAGVIIHENRFTYQQKGLIKLMDLGEYWEQETNAPIPLGGIVINRMIEKDVHKKVDLVIKKSLEYSFEHYPHISAYVSEHSQEMSEDVMRKHIDLYVNNYSLALGEEGKAAVRSLLDVYSKIRDNSIACDQLFVEE